MGVVVEDAPEQPATGPKAGTAIDRRDMARMGKRQELRVSKFFLGC